MQELIESLPVPPKMVKKFAIATVLITACIAVLADGGNREAIGNEIDEQRQAVRMSEQDAKLHGPAKISPSPVSRGGGGFGSEGPVEPAGEGYSIADSSGRSGTTQVQSHDLGSISPEALYARQGKLPPQTNGPLWKKPKIPTEAEKANLLRAAEERAGPATIDR